MALRKANGVAIREFRKALGISPAELAASAGVDRSTLWRIEVGTHQPRPPTLWKIAERLQVPLGAISSTIPEPEPEDRVAS
jgi:transcriptional regulator with XRE-family HTH domain